MDPDPAIAEAGDRRRDPAYLATGVEPVPVWLCGDDGCHLVAPSNYEPEPTAEVLWLPTPNALF